MLRFTWVDFGATWYCIFLQYHLTDMIVFCKGAMYFICPFLTCSGRINIYIYWYNVIKLPTSFSIKHVVIFYSDFALTLHVPSKIIRSQIIIIIVVGHRDQQHYHHFEKKEKWTCVKYLHISFIHNHSY